MNTLIDFVKKERKKLIVKSIGEKHTDFGLNLLDRKYQYASIENALSYMQTEKKEITIKNTNE